MNHQNRLLQTGHHYRRTSTLSFGKHGLRVRLSISSTLNRKTRRTLLLRMFKELKSVFRELVLSEIRHDDSPSGTLLSLNYRGTKGKDALQIQTQDQAYGFQLRVMRNQNLWTQKDLARKLNVSPAYVSRIERGERPATTRFQKELIKLQVETTTARKLSSN